MHSFFRLTVKGSSWVGSATLMVCLFFLRHCAMSQEASVLGGYDFSEPGYTLIFHISDRVRHEYVLYTQEREMLEAYKQAWVFDEEAATYPFGCIDGYNIELQKDFKTTEVFGVRFRCKAFIARGEYWHLPAGLALVSLKLDTAIVADRQYKSLRDAREDLALVKNNPSIIGVSSPEWERHDGYFHFRYPNPGHSSKSPAVDWDKLTEEVRLLLKEKFPREEFSLQLTYHGYGKNYPTVGFKLSGKKSLFSAFALYPKSDKGWIGFEPKLTFYKTK